MDPIVGERNTLLVCQRDKAVGKIRISSKQGRIDVPRDHTGITAQHGVEPDLGELRGIVLRRQNRAGLARMRPQPSTQNCAERDT